MIWQVFGILFVTAFLWKLLASLNKILSERGAIRKLPCPPGAHWLFGHQKQGPFDPGYKWLLDTVKAFPRVFTLWQGVLPLPVLVHPDTIKPLLTGAVANTKSAFYDLFADWVGDGLVRSKSAKWKRNRRLLTHSFHLDVLRTYTPVFNDCVEVLIGKMDQLAAQGKPIDVNHELVLCTFDVILRTAFSYKSDCQIEAGDPLTTPRDFLDTLLMAKDEDGNGFTVEEMADEVNTFMFAGHETTATSMTWLLYNLAKYPEHQTKIREEVDEILGDRDSDRIITKDLNRMAYTTLVMKESMRMMTAGPLVSRVLTAPYTIDGVTLPVGTMLGISIHQLHHNPSVWGEDHMEFKPSRFLPENLAKMDPFAFLSFSAGSRNCIGQQFALNKIKVFVARILRRFRLSLVPGDPAPVANMTVVSKPVIPLYIRLQQINGKS
ncbi:cytochrome P450 4F22-like isoform X2 [Patiria miniata]|uniref:Cytochrome P450 n=1 Tax=Patiria miniata TaxID=46514 RepID=A0A914B2I5_PATMI|nr:cytochrome P450 4F22-like isoform X2 [Patiria miniata]